MDGRLPFYVPLTLPSPPRRGRGRGRVGRGTKLRVWQRLLPWLVTAGCFVYLYSRLARAAAAEGRGLGPYLAAIFENVSWSRSLLLMVPYCALFVLIDSLVVWRVITWFNARLRYADVLPIRASAYILSIVNEQVSKGAIALYLSRRNGIPAWEVGSSMLFIMFCEYYYLLMWATVGVLLQWDRLRHYAAVIALRSPAMLAAVVVYGLALKLFGVTVGLGEMLGYLPVIFFGAAMPGPMHSVAIVLCVLLFPEQPGTMTTFGFVQHNFFILFTAGIGLLFLRRATRELLAKAP